MSLYCALSFSLDYSQGEQSRATYTLSLALSLSLYPSLTYSYHSRVQKRNKTMRYMVYLNIFPPISFYITFIRITSVPSSI